MPEFTVFYGSLISPLSLDAYRALPQCLIAVDDDGVIAWLEDDVPAHALQEVLAQHGCTDTNVFSLRSREFLMPGFVDTHIHAPQVPNMGVGQQYELLDWLDKVTFPTEIRFSDVEFARKTYESVVRRVLNSGSTTCAYYASLHLEATKVLAEVIFHAGQRALVGKCNMDRNCPPTYVDPSADASMDATKELISYIRCLPSTLNTSQQEYVTPLVNPILTPRFAISCTPNLLRSLGDLASADPNLRIQTHISENMAEIKYTKELFPEAPHYAGVYEMFGLLKENTILAHAVHLDDDEAKMVKKAKAGVSHCPTSNFNLRSGVAPIGKFLDMGIKVGLGTDVSGGFSPSMLDAIRNASIASKVMSMLSTSALAPPSSNLDPQSSVASKYTDRQLPLSVLLYLATQGGADVCTLANVGRLEPGMAFDALLVSVRDDAGNPKVWGKEMGGDLGKEELEGILERFFFCGDDRNIKRVYVQGKFVGGKEYPASY